MLNLVGHDRGRDFVQQAHGVDVEYSRGHLVMRGDAVLSTWHVPLAADAAQTVALRALAGALEPLRATNRGLAVPG